MKSPDPAQFGGGYFENGDPPQGGLVELKRFGPICGEELQP